MRRFIPYPVLTLALMSMWLVLNDSFAATDVVLGLVAGLAAGVLYARLEPPRGRLGNSLVPAASLAWAVAVDIVQSNVAVLPIALRLSGRGRASGFLAIPLELRDPRGLAVLAGIVTATPGTTWAHYDDAAHVLTLHVLDMVDEAAWVRQFKHKYERRLMEIFQ